MRGLAKELSAGLLITAAGPIILSYFAGQGKTIGNDFYLRLAVSSLKKRLVLALSTLLATGKQA
jgi:hypothetical protein